MRDLLRAVVKTGSGSAFTVLCGMVTVKVIAASMGPAGLGTFSLAKQMVVAGSTVFITGGQTALVQGFARRSGESRERFVSTAWMLFLSAGAVLLLVSELLAPLVAKAVLGSASAENTAAVRIGGVAIALSAPLAFVFGALNGARRIGRLAIAQASNALMAAIVAWPICHAHWESAPVRFALLLLLSQLPGLLLGGWWILQERATFPRPRCEFDRGHARDLLRLAGATVAAAVMQAWAVLVVRSMISGQRGVAVLGIFDVAWTMSMVYVMLVLTSFSTYYLPTLAQMKGEQRERLMQQVVRLVLLLVVPLILLVIAFRPLAIMLLYTREFLPALPIMRWMLVGDYLKVTSFVLAMPMLADSDVKPFLWGEAVWNVGLVGATQLALQTRLGVEGIGAGFMILYAGYLAYCWHYCRRRGYRMPGALAMRWVLGLALVVTASVIHWDVDRVSVGGTSFVLCAIAIQVFCVLGRTSKKSSAAETPIAEQA